MLSPGAPAQRGADLHDRAPVARAHPGERGHGAVHVAEVGDLGDTAELGCGSCFIFMLRQIRSMSEDSVAGSNGLATTPLAPTRIYSSVSVLLIRAVMNTTGMSRPDGDFRNLRSVAGPSISGIITSSRTRSG